MSKRDAEFRAYVDGTSGRLLRLSFLLVGDRHAAEDLLQDVLERLYVRWPKVQDPDAYARRALANAATNRWRSRARRPETALLAHHDVAAPETAPSRRDELVVALGQLPNGQRAVIVLRYLEDLSVEQVAAVLGCSTGTVKSQTARALPRLRDLLALDEETCS
ncbi:MAG: subfamily polymerase sigma-24 factor [Marmoricola sp.]|nr:subfamily polymerase sigma-24 factor [Marmoricola sp.]